MYFVCEFCSHSNSLVCVCVCVECVRVHVYVGLGQCKACIYEDRDSIAVIIMHCTSVCILPAGYGISGPAR